MRTDKTGFKLDKWQVYEQLFQMVGKAISAQLIMLSLESSLMSSQEHNWEFGVGDIYKEYYLYRTSTD